MPGALQEKLVDSFPGNVVHLSIREAQQDGHKKTWKRKYNIEQELFSIDS